MFTPGIEARRLAFLKQKSETKREEEISNQKRTEEEMRLKQLYPGYKLLKINYLDGICSLGNTPLEVDKFYDIITPDTIKQGKNFGGDSWENVYVKRINGQLTPFFTSRNPFSGVLETTVLRGSFGSKRFLMKPNSEMNNLQNECEDLDSQLGWGNLPSCVGK